MTTQGPPRDLPQWIFGGENSRQLWQDINAVRDSDERTHIALYSLGCALQRFESQTRAMYDAYESRLMNERDTAHEDAVLARTGEVAWKSRAERAEASAEANAKDAAFGAILMRYIDRLTDYDATDPADAIISELSRAVNDEIMRQRAIASESGKGGGG